jgi:hypothetical protein
VKRKFRAYARIEVAGKKVSARLVGVGQSPVERDAMLLQATNGRCALHVETRRTPAGPWFGIYAY